MKSDNLMKFHSKLVPSLFPMNSSDAIESRCLLYRQPWSSKCGHCHSTASQSATSSGHSFRYCCTMQATGNGWRMMMAISWQVLHDSLNSASPNTAISRIPSFLHHHLQALLKIPYKERLFNTPQIKGNYYTPSLSLHRWKSWDVYGSIRGRKN